VATVPGAFFSQKRKGTPAASKDNFATVKFAWVSLFALLIAQFLLRPPSSAHEQRQRYQRATGQSDRCWFGSAHRAQFKVNSV